MKRLIVLSLNLLLLVSCNERRLNFDRGIIPPVAVNFVLVNSLFDDYNSDLQITWVNKTWSLVFSSSRNSLGNQFDFVGYKGNIFFDLVSGEFIMDAVIYNFSVLDVINTQGNEFGPFFTADQVNDPFRYYKSEGSHRFLYTSDLSGNQDIYCRRYCINEQNDFIPEGDATPVVSINTVNSESYLTIHHGEDPKAEVVYFSSDRDGTWDIWRAVGEEGKMINESSFADVTRVSQLSGETDEKCPFINGRLMVFASDREGGHGGFDLWYSLYDAQGWSEPVNFGDEINSEYDEFRPVVVSTEDGFFMNDLMIFSSDRPGGKGGFDLYYAGIKRFN